MDMERGYSEEGCPEAYEELCAKACILASYLPLYPDKATEDSCNY
jgi:hypothetical protein